MHNSKSKKAPLIIAGMHRSGTSLTAAILQKCGLHIGDRLYPPAIGNILGHFENVDFLNLHEDILESLGFYSVGWVPQKSVSVPDQFIDRAREVVERNASESTWGWKDPRTTLFLDFWAKFIDDSNFLFVFRSPWDVVDSLYRRGDKVFFRNPSNALQMWLNYNQAILDFQSRCPERSLVVSVDAVAFNAAAVVDALNKKFDLSLSEPPQNIFDSSLLGRTTSSNHRKILISRLFPESVAVLHELERISMPVGARTDAQEPAADEATNFKDWILKDWVDVRKSERELAEARSQAQERVMEAERLSRQLVDLQSQFQTLTLELCSANEKLTAADERLRQLQLAGEQLVAENIQLKETASQFQETRSQLEETRSQLDETSSQVEQTRSQLEQTRSETELQTWQLTDEVAAARTEIAALQCTLSLTTERLAAAESTSEILKRELTVAETAMAEAEAEHNKLTDELGCTQKMLSAASGDRRRLDDRLTAVHKDLRAAEENCYRYKDALSIAQGKLAAADADREQLKYELGIERDRLAAARGADRQIRHQLKESYKAISAIESTKVWKLRDKYILIKQSLGKVSFRQIKCWLSKTGSQPVSEIAPH